MQPPKSFKEWLALIPIIFVTVGFEAGMRGCAKSISKSYDYSPSYSYTPPLSKSYEYDGSTSLDSLSTSNSDELSKLLEVIKAGREAKIAKDEAKLKEVQLEYEQANLTIKQSEVYYPAGDTLNQKEADFFQLKEFEHTHKHAIPHNVSPHSEFYDTPSSLKYYSEITNKPELISIFPRDVDSFKKIFPDEKITVGIKSELEKFNGKITSTEGVKFVDDGSNIVNQINSSSDRLIVIFGHSTDSGMKIKLPDGKLIEESSIHKTCADAGKLCIILTCNSKDLEIQGLISPFEALDIWDHAIKKSLRTNITNREFLLAMRDRRHTAVYRKNMVITLSLTTAGSAIVYFHNFEVEESVEEKSRP